MLIHIINDEIFGKAVIWSKLKETNVPDELEKYKVTCVLITSDCIKQD